MKPALLLPALLLWVWCNVALEAGEVVRDRARGFTLSLPDGFQADSEIAKANPAIAHAFVRRDTDGQPEIIVMIQMLGGTLGRDSIRPEHIKNFQGRLFKSRWSGFEVDGFEVPEQLGALKALTYNVQIPLKKEAIQVAVFGAEERQEELKAILEAVLSRLEGESNWLSSAAPAGMDEQTYRNIMLVVAAVCVIGGLLVLWIVSKYAPRGTVLVIAALVYGASWTLEGVRIRELVLLSGTLRLLGFAGGILGLVDVARKRDGKANRLPVPPPEKAEEPIDLFPTERSSRDS